MASSVHPVMPALIALALTMTACPDRAVANAEAVVPDEIVRITNDRNDRMTVPVLVGEKGPFAFMIDTGAERTVIARGVALTLGLTPIGHGTLVGVAGTQDVEMVELDAITLGRRSFHNLTAPLLDEQTIGADGIIGLDSLQGQRVLLDFDHHQMAIGDAQEQGGNRGFEIIVVARRKSGQLILTDAVIDGVRTDVMIDTGSDVSVGNRALQRALSRHRAKETTMLVSVTGQTITADIGFAFELRLGGLTLKNNMLAFADAPTFEHLGLVKRPALMLGMAQLRPFHRVAIDFAARRVLFDVPSIAQP